MSSIEGGSFGGHGRFFESEFLGFGLFSAFSFGKDITIFTNEVSEGGTPDSFFFIAVVVWAINTLFTLCSDTFKVFVVQRMEETFKEIAREAEFFIFSFFVISKISSIFELLLAFTKDKSSAILLMMVKIAINFNIKKIIFVDDFTWIMFAMVSKWAR